MMRRLFVTCLGFFGFVFTNAQQLDVLHYKFEIALSDKSDSIYGKAEMDFQTMHSGRSITLDFAEGAQHRMAVKNVFGKNVSHFSYVNSKILISLKESIPRQKQHIIVTYAGIPGDGLIISKNKYGERTFFSDNWPDRAHYWIPCHDVPDDKASFEFIVTAPDHYQVISNGYKVAEKQEDGNRRLTHWKEDVPLSTKVMVIGVGRFAIKEFNFHPDGIPVTAWIYPPDSTNGFHDYGTAPAILAFFSQYIAPFPYNKLANVQSKTVFGGMENASAIFYNEATVTGTGQVEDVMAHEIAHQWFGDMVSEKTFADLWLSEGFATYCADLYIESKYGKDSATKRLAQERGEIIAYAKMHHQPVVDTSSNFLSLLNANSYQKGSWFLHMLRNATGDSLFQLIIRRFYERYKGGNANTRDFEVVTEKVTAEDFHWFFNQWLFQPGLPEIHLEWKFGPSASGPEVLSVRVRKEGNYLFKKPFEVLFIYADNSKELKAFSIDDNASQFIITGNKKPRSIVLDPNVKLLFSGNVLAL